MSADKPRRGGPYVWASWLPKLIAGEVSCDFSVWYRAHFQFARREEDPERQQFLARWVAKHTDGVKARVAQLEDNGWTVEVERKITFRGRLVTIAMKPDIVARRDGELLVSDVKAGRRRNSDTWQVWLYLCFVDRAGSETATGEVAYYDDETGEFDLLPLPDVHGEDRARIYAAIAAAGSRARPEPRPSASECAFCPVAACEARIEDEPAAIQTEAF